MYGIWKSQYCSDLNFLPNQSINLKLIQSSAVVTQPSSIEDNATKSKYAHNVPPAIYSISGTLFYMCTRKHL